MITTKVPKVNFTLLRDDVAYSTLDGGPISKTDFHHSLLDGWLAYLVTEPVSNNIVNQVAILTNKHSDHYKDALQDAVGSYIERHCEEEQCGENLVAYQLLPSIQLQELKITGYIDCSVLNFIGYEFEHRGEGFYVEEYGHKTHWFRLEVDKGTNNKTIYMSHTEELNTYEDASDDFGDALTEVIYKLCNEVDRGTIADNTAEYLRFLADRLEEE